MVEKQKQEQEKFDEENKGTGEKKKIAVFGKWDAEIADKKMEAAKRAFEVEMRNMKRLCRKNALEFFLEKSDNVIQIFKEQQMHMAESYFNLKKQETKT